MNQNNPKQVEMLTFQEILCLKLKDKIEYRDALTGDFYYGYVTESANDTKVKKIGLKLFDYNYREWKDGIFKICNLLLYPHNSILGQKKVFANINFAVKGDRMLFRKPDVSKTQSGNKWQTGQVVQLYGNGFIQLQFGDGTRYWTHQFLKGEIGSRIPKGNNGNNFHHGQHPNHHHHHHHHHHQNNDMNGSQYTNQQYLLQQQRQMNVMQEQTVSVHLLIEATETALKMLTEYGDALVESLTTRGDINDDNGNNGNDDDEQDTEMVTQGSQQSQQSQKRKRRKRKRKSKKHNRSTSGSYEIDDNGSLGREDDGKENDGKETENVTCKEMEKKVELCNIKAITGLTLFEGQVESFLEKSNQRMLDPEVGIKNSEQMMNKFLNDTELRLKKSGYDDQVIGYVLDRLSPFIKGMKSVADGNELPSFKTLKRSKFDKQVANSILTSVLGKLNHAVPDMANKVRNNYQEIAIQQKKNALELDDDKEKRNKNDFTRDDANNIYRDIHRPLKDVKTGQQSLIDAQKATERDEREAFQQEPNCFE